MLHLSLIHILDVYKRQVIDCLAKAAAPDTEGISDWLNVCTEIKENLQAVDDAMFHSHPI